jgi:hypothetical protein
MFWPCSSEITSTGSSKSTRSSLGAFEAKTVATNTSLRNSVYSPTPITRTASQASAFGTDPSLGTNSAVVSNAAKSPGGIERDKIPAKFLTQERAIESHLRQNDLSEMRDLPQFISYTCPEKSYSMNDSISWLL